MQLYNFKELVRAFGMSTSLILEMPQMAKDECLYVVNDGDIYVFTQDANGKTIPLFRADFVKELPRLFREINCGIWISGYYSFDPTDLFCMPREQRITPEEYRN